MFKKMLLFVLLLGLALPVMAQDPDEADARVDQAFAHLNDWLGRDDITRLENDFTYEELIYDSESLGCPLDGIIYEQTQRRGWQVTIEVDDIVFDYRMNEDGSVLVLCNDAGLPDYRSDHGTYPTPTSQPPIPTLVPVTHTAISPTPTSSALFPTNTPESSSQTRPTPTSIPDNAPSVTAEPDSFVSATAVAIDSIPVEEAGKWFAWAYVEETDTLVLLNAEGVVREINRPIHSDEATEQHVTLTFSPDGQYLVQTIHLADNSYALMMNDLSDGSRETRIYDSSEIVLLGTPYIQADGVQPAANFIMDYPSTQLVVGVFEGISWRLEAVKLATGDVMRTIDGDTVLANLNFDIPENALVFPRPVYIDSDGNAHVQLIYDGTEINREVPTFAWNIARNRVEESPFGFSDIDFLPANDVAAFAYLDDDLPSMSLAEPVIVNNTIGQHVLGNLLSSRLYTNGSVSVRQPRWAADGRYITFETMDDVGDRQHVLYETGTSPTTAFLLPESYEQVFGVSGGVIADSDGAMVYHTTENEVAVIWDYEAGRVTIMWTTQPERPILLEVEE